MNQPINHSLQPTHLSVKTEKNSQSWKGKTISHISKCLSHISYKIHHTWTSFLISIHLRPKKKQPDLSKPPSLSDLSKPLHHSIKVDPQTHEYNLGKILSDNGYGKKAFTKDTINRNRIKANQLGMGITFNSGTSNTVSLARDAHLLSNQNEGVSSPIEGFFTDCDRWLKNTCAIADKNDRELLVNLISLVFTQYGMGCFVMPIAKNLKCCNNGQDLVPSPFANMHDLDYKIEVKKDKDGITLETKITSKSPIEYMTKKQVQDYAIAQEEYEQNKQSPSAMPPTRPSFYTVLPGSTNRFKYHFKKGSNNEKPTISVSDDKVIYKLRKSKS